MLRLMSGEYLQNGNSYSMASKEEMKELDNIRGKGKAEYSVANTCYLRTDVFQNSRQGRQHLISLKTAASALLLSPDQAHTSPARTMKAKERRMQLTVSGGWDKWEALESSDLIVQLP